MPSATCARRWQSTSGGAPPEDGCLVAAGHFVFRRVEIPTSVGAAGAEDLSERGRGERDDNAGAS